MKFAAARAVMVIPLWPLWMLALEQPLLAMELDVQSDGHSSELEFAPGDIHMDVDASESQLPGADCAWRPAGPIGDAVLEWAPQCLEMVKHHPLGSRLLGYARSRFANGIMMASAYSGVGGPEIALHRLPAAFNMLSGESFARNNVIFWSAADAATSAREVLQVASP